MLRSILFDDITEQRYQGLVFSTLRSLLRARLIAKMPWNYVDATNLSAHERRQWIKMAKSFGYEAQAVFFDVPLEVCMERNSRRERTVSDDIMRKMAERLRPPSFKEGFSKITMVRVKGAPPLKMDGVVVEPPTTQCLQVKFEESLFLVGPGVHSLLKVSGTGRVPGVRQSSPEGTAPFSLWSAPFLSSQVLRHPRQAALFTR